jgi:hypothetical protein
MGKRGFHIFALLLFLAIGCLAKAQSTRIRGVIKDAQTNEPLPYVTIVFKGSSIGTISDLNGEYYIETRTPSDSLYATYVGYKSETKSIVKKKFQVVNFSLEPVTLTLHEVIVTPGENPAHIILRKILANKIKNNPVKLPGYSFEAYNKLEFDVNNVDEKFKKRKVFKQFQFIFQYVDTSAETGKSYLPIFLTETLSDYYFQRNPRRIKEIIKASHISGLEDANLTQFTGQMHIDVNIYSNYIEAFGKNFVSPIADFGLLFYKYYLIDSSFIDHSWCYHLTFQPKRKQELTFTGDFWVSDTSFAIKRAKARIAEDANINYVKNLTVTQEYERINDTTWFLSKDETFVDFNIGDKSTGLFGRKTSSYKNIKVGLSEGKKFFNDKVPEESIVLKGATSKDTTYWNASRHEKLSTKEENIYAMVDSITKVPIFNTFVDLVTMFVDGYYVHHWFEFGPYYKTTSYNPIEGNRFRLGLRTSNEFSTKVMYSGHIAYGTKDERLKYSAGLLYLLSIEPRRAVNLSYKYDIEQLGQSINAFTEDNILSSILARNPKNKLLMVKEYKGSYEREWFDGFTNKLQFYHREIFPSSTIQFEDAMTKVKIPSLTSSELTLTTRFAYNEKFLKGKFETYSLGSDYPIIQLDFTTGLKDFIQSDYEYYKIHGAFSHHFNINPIGYLKYNIQVGRIWGRLPYPLLRLHEGNETYAFDEYAFNMMNYYEFVSDRYASLYLEHHFDGFFLNHIPLLRKLKLREIAYGKGLIGSLSNKTLSVMDFPVTLSGLNKPYAEAGVGIENLLKIIRIDAIWRLTYLDHQNVQPFGIRASLQLIF